MNTPSDTFRPAGKILGGCAGIAALAGIDPLLVRIAAVLAFCLVSHKLTLIAYLIAALVTRLAFGHARD